MGGGGAAVMDVVGAEDDIDIAKVPQLSCKLAAP